MDKCEGCVLYKNGKCTIYRVFGEKPVKPNPSSRDWLDDSEYDFISEYRMCCYGSIFGNDYIGLTTKDIERIKNGEIIHIPGEYGIFIGFVDNEEEKK